AHDATRACSQLGLRLQVAGSELADEVPRHVERSAEEIADRFRRFSRWIVHPGPGVIVAIDKVGDEHSGDHAVGDALTGIAAGDKHPITAGAMADEGRVIDGVEDLSRPPVADRTELAEPSARPV